ncbi:uncharacterized protein TNCV_868221 [Trichonephila clavipes]|nr:uncharacterized protein TNCV_868221 [Trichonephila clavipes]
MLYLDGGKSKSRELTVTVTPVKTMERRGKQPSDATLCYREKILGLYDLSPESVPRELLQDLDIYIPTSCDSSIFDISPVYGILISEEQPNLNNVIQLTEEFVFFPLPEGKLTLPSCHLSSESPIKTKYHVQIEENSLPHVICHASGCAKWISVKDDDYTIPCDMKFAARGLLATDYVILNHGQVTWTTPELAPPLLTTTPHQREDVSALDRFNVHRCPTRRVFSGTGLEFMTCLS